MCIRLSPDPKPFTPEGTGTVLDNATDQDGKEFFTITTADEAVFYLVIDSSCAGQKRNLQRCAR